MAVSFLDLLICWLLMKMLHPELFTKGKLKAAYKPVFFPLDEMLVHRRLIPNIKFTITQRETLWEISVSPKNTTQGPWSGLKPELFDAKLSTITMKPLPFTKYWWIFISGIGNKTVSYHFRIPCKDLLECKVNILNTVIITVFLFCMQSKTLNFQLGQLSKWHKLNF